MKSMIENIIGAYRRFEAWFNTRYGWFFTNGMKAIQEQESHRA